MCSSKKIDSSQMQRNQFCDPSLAHQTPSFLVQQGRNLPAIPSPSPKLQDLLCRYSFNVSDPEIEDRNSRRNRYPQIAKKRRINGFIAFRSFYSKTIKGTSHQKELSSKLAAIWKTEPHHQTWKSYALQYNATGGSEPFVSWLNRQLGFEMGQTEKTIKTYKNLSLRNVEDVFFEN